MAEDAMLDSARPNALMSQQQPRQLEDVDHIVASVYDWDGPVTKADDTILGLTGNLSSYLLNGTDLPGDDDDTGRNEDVAKWEMALLAVMLCSAVIGNVVVLVALGLRRQRLTRMYFFMTHLCVADLTVAFFHILPQLCWEITYRFRGNNFLCKATKFLQLLGPYLSSYVLVATALDRYRAVCFPLAQPSWTVRHARAAVWAAWVISLLFALPQLFIFSYRQIPGSTEWDCWGEFAQPYGEKAYITWFTLANTLVPLAVLMYTYTAICWAVWLNFRVKKAAPARRQTSTPPSEAKITTNCGPNKDSRGNRGKDDEEEEEAFVDPPRIHSMQGISRAKIKTVKLTIVVIACYTVASMPYTCAMLWTVYTPDAAHSTFYASPWYALLTLLASLNSCVNPWVYLFFNASLLRIVQEALGCPRPPCCRSSTCCCPPDDQGRLRRIPVNNVVPFNRNSLSETSLMQSSNRRNSNPPSKGLLCAALTQQVTGKATAGNGTGSAYSSPSRTLAPPIVFNVKHMQPKSILKTKTKPCNSSLATSASESALQLASCFVFPRASTSAPTIACQGAHVSAGNGNCACEPV